MKFDIRPVMQKTVKRKKMIQAAIARDMGISPARLSAILNGKTQPTAVEYLDFCSVVDVSASDIATEAKEYGEKTAS